ncbi:MAG: hypothetical protein CFE26_20435, partial [Verrucomicrobiales bacterium VVV1]
MFWAAVLFPGGVSAAIKDYGLKDYVRVSKDLPHAENEPWKLVCTMPYNCHFPAVDRSRGGGRQG